MKNYTLLMATLSLIALSACTQGLNDSDRQLLASTHSEAMEAKNQAVMANQSAAQAAQNAAASAAAAQAANERADRMLRYDARK